jgi:hypothetical protein
MLIYPVKKPVLAIQIFLTFLCDAAVKWFYRKAFYFFIIGNVEVLVTG